LGWFLVEVISNYSVSPNHAKDAIHEAISINLKMIKDTNIMINLMLVENFIYSISRGWKTFLGIMCSNCILQLRQSVMRVLFFSDQSFSKSG
jgi:Na+-transporting NADH:ubiquinone oxidoreductase subunit NqrD